MQLRSSIIAIIIAAAAGGSIVRAFGTRGSPDVPASGIGMRDAAKSSPAGGDARHGTASSATAIVYVAGAVARPGVYAVPASARANDALRAAGGAAPNADLVAVNLAARIADGDEIAVPVRGAKAAGGDVTSGTSRRARRTRAQSGSSGSKVRRRRKRRATEAGGSADVAGAADAPNDIVDVNAASEAELETLPGVGPSLAERIIAFRDLNGPFASSDELLDVGGMTAGKVDALSPYVGFR